MSFSWTSVTQGVSKLTTTHFNEVQTNTNSLCTKLGISNYTWSHLPVAAGTTGLYTDLIELRNALDYVHNNNTCATHWASHLSSVNGTNDTSYNNNVDTGHLTNNNSSYNNNVDTGHLTNNNSSYNNNVDTGHLTNNNSSYNNNVDTGYLGNHDSSYLNNWNGSYCDDYWGSYCGAHNSYHFGSHLTSYNNGTLLGYYASPYYSYNNGGQYQSYCNAQ